LRFNSALFICGFEGFLLLNVAPWKRVLITRSVAIVPSILVAILAQGSLDVLDEWLNVLQSVQLPFALIPGPLSTSKCDLIFLCTHDFSLVLVFTSDERIMGIFKNHFAVRIATWLLALFAMGTNFYLIYIFLRTLSFPF
jgi:Mn2+/Fe2+ NRAMP family transporter